MKTPAIDWLPAIEYRPAMRLPTSIRSVTQRPDTALVQTIAGPGKLETLKKMPEKTRFRED
jgi:hypothetical protein